MTKNTEERIPEESIDPKSKIAREANAFLDAIAGGADEDEADEAAFLALNPNGVVVDEEGDVLKKGAKSAIEVGEKVEFEEGEVEQPEITEATDGSASSPSLNAEDEEPAEESDNDSDDDLGDEALVTFEDLGLADEVLEAIKALNYETPYGTLPLRTMKIRGGKVPQRAQEPPHDERPHAIGPLFGNADLPEHEHEAQNGQKEHQGNPFRKPDNRLARQNPHESTDPPKQGRIRCTCQKSNGNKPEQAAENGFFEPLLQYHDKKLKKNTGSP